MHKSFLRVAALLVSVVLLTGSAFALVRGTASEALDPRLESQLAGLSATEGLLVFVHAGNAGEAKGAVSAAGLDLVEVFEKVGVAVAFGTPKEVRAVAQRPGVTHVEPDRPIEFFMEASHVATRGEEAEKGFSITTTAPATNKQGKQKGKQTTTTTVTSPGVDGSGVSIAIVDSGIDGTHPMFQTKNGSKVVRNMKLVPCAVKLGRNLPDPLPDGVEHPAEGALTGQPCFGTAPDWLEGDVWIEDEAMQDSDTPSMGGHGTHVAGIAGGGHVALNPDKPGETLHGAASGAHLIGLSVGQVLSVYGGDSGLNWVLENHRAPCGEGVDAAVCPPIKVVNNSYGPVGGGEFAATDATSKLQDKLVSEGVTVVWAAGNDGGDGTANKTNPPGQSPTPGVLMVANFDDANAGVRNGTLNSSSSRGDRTRVETYPDISAPGTKIKSACRPYLAICTSADSAEDPRFGTISGTSMAAPHIAGIVAQLIEAGRQSFGRDLTPAEIEDLIEDNAFKFEFSLGGVYKPDVSSNPDVPSRNPDSATSFDKGHGLVDVKEAVAEIRQIALEAETPIKTALTCSQGGSMILDPSGDTYVVKLLSPVEQDVPPYEPGLDITEGSVTWDSASSSLTAQIKVADLPEAEGPTTPGVAYYLSFFRGSERFFLEAARSPAGESYNFSQSFSNSAAQAREHLFETTGAFDAAADTISMTVTNEQLSAAGLSPFAAGEILSSAAFASRVGLEAEVTTLGVLATDTTADACEFVIGQGLRPASPPPPPPPPETDGSLSSGSPEYSWTGGPVVGFGAPFFVMAPPPNCEVPTNCDERLIEISVPTGGATLSVTAIAEDPSGLESGIPDYDLYVYGPDGSLLDHSAQGGTNESVSVPITASGIYRVVVFAWATAAVEYSGVARLN